MDIKKHHIERIEIVGKQEEVKKAFDYCLHHGYSVMRAGPKPSYVDFQYDVDYFLIIAEREI